MPKEYPSLPSVNASLRRNRDYAFRGNTFGQNGSYRELTAADREKAARFDLVNEIRLAEQALRESLLTCAN